MARAFVVVATVFVPLLAAQPAGAAAHAEINGSGSSWAENAVNQWVADVHSEGIEVVYNPDGDAQGRQDFANDVSDFSVTADGYQGKDPVTGVSDTSQGRPYAYLPIAAGGTSFPYQIRYDGQQVENLRLSGETLAKIFTNQITNWDDSEITKDNNGHALPSLPITPVVQSEGSGATEQLTNYFATEFPSIWQSYSGQSGPTEYFPRQGNQIAQNGSNGAMNYVASSSANGSISYVEYSFALSVNYPVAKVLNSAGYFTLPTQYNVAVALEDAQINMDQSSPDYLLQNLTNVYTDPDPRTYPLSSYVYMIEPTGSAPAETHMTTAKRQSIADFGYYSICQGQKEIGPIGYSPLPVNLVEAGFGQIAKLQQADSGVDLTNENIDTCDNPTFVEGQPNTNYLATIAPLPPACDMEGAGPCAAGVTPNGIGATPTSSGTYPGTGASTKTTSPGGSGATSTAGGGVAGAASGSSPTGAAATGSAGGSCSGANSASSSGSSGSGPAATTTTKLTTSPIGTASSGTSVTLTATVTPSTAAGTVQFRSDSQNVGAAVPVSAGTATLPTADLPTGTHALTAVFTPTPDSGNGTSTSEPVSFTVTAATTTTSPGGSGAGGAAGGQTAGAAGGSSPTGGAATGSAGGPCSGANAAASSGSSGSGSGAGSAAPTLDSTDLSRLGDSTFWAKAAPFAVIALLLVFAIPAAIGYRRSRIRRGGRG
jgi:phosphate transport system substrate-binding protein